MESDAILVPATQVRRVFGGISHMTLWRWVKRGVLPEPVKINERNYWRKEDVDAVLNKASEK